MCDFKWQGHGGRRTLSFVFTEHGAIMAANALNSKQAVEVSNYIVKALVMSFNNCWPKRKSRKERSDFNERYITGGYKLEIHYGLYSPPKKF